MTANKFVMRENPKIKVEVVGEAERRIGAKLKWDSVLYHTGDNRITVRDREEFYRMFMPVSG